MRAYYGPESLWYRAAARQRTGRIMVGRLAREVSFEPIPAYHPVQAYIDEAYRAKYGRSPYFAPMVSVRARSATVKVLPY